MYENDTQEPAKYQTVQISATVTNEARDYVNERVRQEKQRTFTSISFSAMLNRIILEHRKYSTEENK